ncbi:NADH-quinone oxidoreductase subunit L [Thalassotalea sp. PS06]|uniref:NADH-quinone oxidoreductase subunit L n=1 Tax=Thalassotalea sp. PS06 TaxID=2594005 RepID=UPI0021B1318F|nr:NADH-quinone oxidoreductase subunit L [Thalassotalea sp. PS06]
MDTLSLLPFFPLLSFILLIVLSKRLSWTLATIIALVGVGLSFTASIAVIGELNQISQGSDAAENGLTRVLWTWFMLGEHEVRFAFYVDHLTAVMIAVVTGVGFLIHGFAAAYMRDDQDYSRFMAYMNLFICAMLLLVLAENLVLLYLGWEGVGLCSFLLIGFWYKDPANAIAARKAFIVTRIGDTLLALGLFYLFMETNTLNIQEILAQQQQSPLSADAAWWIALLLLGGAVGKSAQLPLQTWLPDAMAGPTPVSALIHAATMVTAGVYLIARMQGVYLLAPEILNLVAWVGSITLLIAGFAALAQEDIKRVLAYSTMSQIGYMMLGLGAGANVAAITHLMTHAFFKALLFLGAGAIILAVHHQQDIFKMGGLLKRMPLISVLFLIGIAALIAFPGTSGFVSKEAIIGELWQSPTAGPVFWWMAVIGALITSVYSFRLVFITFFGDYRGEHQLHAQRHFLIVLPLSLLAVLAIIGGYIPTGLEQVFIAPEGEQANTPGWLHTAAIAIPLIGIAVAYFIYFPHKDSPQPSPGMSFLYQFNRSGLGFDDTYNAFFVKPFVWIAHLNRSDLVDQIVKLISWNTFTWSSAFKAVQSGRLRWYAATLGIGTGILLLGVML